MRTPSDATSLLDKALMELWSTSPDFRRILIEKVRETLKQAGIILTGEGPHDEQIAEFIRRHLEDRAD
jgi:hypothetical protein